MGLPECVDAILDWTELNWTRVPWLKNCIHPLCSESRPSRVHPFEPKVGKNTALHSSRTDRNSPFLMLALSVRSTFFFLSSLNIKWRVSWALWIIHLRVIWPIFFSPDTCKKYTIGHWWHIGNVCLFVDGFLFVCFFEAVFHTFQNISKCNPQIQHDYATRTAFPASVAILINIRCCNTT